jgi:FkbM family methyltransferase
VLGIFQSNTKYFEDNLSWTGILIEPNEKEFNKLKINRPNNFLFNDLVSCYKNELEYKWIDNVVAVAGVSNTLTEMHNNFWYGNFVKEKCLNINTKLIKPKTLTEIIKSTGIKYIDFLSLDVEGHEYEVLKSWDFSVPINIILIEMLGIDTEKEELCREILLQNGYSFEQKFAHNEIFKLKLLNTSKS